MQKDIPYPFRSELSVTTFNNKYRHEGCESWYELARTLVEDVCLELLPQDEKDELVEMISSMQFIPGGRYLYYAGRKKKFFNNCYLLRAEEDSREDWANLSWKSESCLLTGGGIGIDYSRYREAGSPIRSTGGVASGPIPKMLMVNEIGRRVMQGGSRRSAVYASLLHSHPDVGEFLETKNWDRTVVPGTKLSLADVKRIDYNWPAPLDGTNVSVNYDTDWLMNLIKTGDPGEVFRRNVEQALTTGEPGFSFNFFDKENETLRNACTEVSSCDDSDVCNLGSINLSRIGSIGHFSDVVALSTKFLLCGTLRADLPYAKIAEVREKNRRLGLGLMGIHEWLIQKGKKYEVTRELHDWLRVYKGVSDTVSRDFSYRLGVSTPVANRAIAPTGTIGILAGTTTGIEPVYAIAYKRRYLTRGTQWKYQYHVDYVAHNLIEQGVDPDTIETSITLAGDYKKRIKFQAEVQDYVDMGISSTLNLPALGVEGLDADRLKDFTTTLAHYAPRLRGLTCYPDGARGGQPLNSVPYAEAVEHLGKELEENIEFNENCKEGICGV